jgi:hypothetical protein
VSERSRLSIALLISVLLHGLWLTAGSTAWRGRRLLPPVPEILDVDLVRLPALSKAKPAPAAKPAPPPVLLPKRQIVSPSDAGEEKPPQQTNLLSDRDNTVVKESVHQGNPSGDDPNARDSTFNAGKNGAEEAEAVDAAAPKPAAEPASEKEASKRQASERQVTTEAVAEKPAPLPKQAAGESARQAQTQVAALPRLDQLLPPAGDVFVPDTSESDEPTARQRQARVRRNLLGARSYGFSSRPGITDYLPTIQPGDITMLNTKAELFAPFVRRVAMRVFQHLELNLRRAADRGGGRGREFAVVEAVMDRSGKLLSSRVLQRQSDTSLAAYRELLAVARPDVFFDSNPPAGAEGNDGNIHFILLVDLMVEIGPDPRTGRMTTAYHGMAGVGLDTLNEDRGDGEDDQE